ncbi:hypothetical protein NEE01_22025 [Sphingomonas sp. MMSM24]|uniref:DUF7847 domain-containing protein n=2 Tax=Sphingomonas lycopersici TaxID=2951807 RepID=A0AA41ZE69_9SPHN|nr:hypothetical protein [Sphingomonas lycopersici]
MVAYALGDDHHRMSVGRAFARAFAIIRAHPLLTIGTTFAMTMIPSLLFSETSLNEAITGAYYGALTDSFFLKMMMGWVVQLFFWAVAVAAVIQAGLAYVEGRRPDLGEILYTGGMRSLPMLAVYLLYAIATGIGFTLLLVPGIFLAVIWSMAMVAMVAEEPGVFGAFKRSAALTNGARWKILGILLLTVAIALIVNLLGGFVVLTAGLRPETQPAALPAQIVMSLLNTIVLTWTTTMFTALFVELREWKDGPDTDRLGDIFA